MESCLNTLDLNYKDIKEYKNDINIVIENMLIENEPLIFAVIAKKSNITPFEIRKYPELRNYILKRMTYYKEMDTINKKIDKAVKNLLNSKKRITFMAIIHKCKFNFNTIYENEYIKTKIRKSLMENKVLT